MNNLEKWMPQLDRILVKEVLPDDAVTKSGLIIPSEAVKNENSAKTCRVIKLGTGVKDEKFLANEGDLIMTSKYAGSEVSIDFEEYHLIRNTDILMVFKETTDSNQ